jgi:hypothetical protein
MTILNLYQAALIVTMAVVVLAAQWAKRRMESEAGVSNIAGAEQPSPPKPVLAENLNALNSSGSA